MGRQQLFLELLYRHALMYLPAVLIFFFGRLWKITFVDKLLFFYLGWLAEDRFVLGTVPGLPWSPLSFSYVIMGLGMGLMSNTKDGCISLALWTHNNPSKSCFSTLLEERRILMSLAHLVYSSPLLSELPNAFLPSQGMLMTL